MRVIREPRTFKVQWFGNRRLWWGKGYSDNPSPTTEHISRDNTASMAIVIRFVTVTVVSFMKSPSVFCSMRLLKFTR